MRENKESLVYENVDAYTNIVREEGFFGNYGVIDILFLSLLLQQHIKLE